MSSGFQAATHAVATGIKTVGTSDEELLRACIEDVQGFRRWLRYAHRRDRAR